MCELWQSKASRSSTWKKFQVRVSIRGQSEVNQRSIRKYVTPKNGNFIRIIPLPSPPNRVTNWLFFMLRWVICLLLGSNDQRSFTWYWQPQIDRNRRSPTNAWYLHQFLAGSTRAWNSHFPFSSPSFPVRKVNLKIVALKFSYSEAKN